MGDHGDRDLLQGNARYRKLQDLNEGTFGVVMLALDTQAREQVAIKFLERGAGERSLKLCFYCAHPLAETVVHKFQAHALLILLSSSCLTPEAEAGKGSGTLSACAGTG
jgi:serine/threonine protein kinase